MPVHLKPMGNRLPVGPGSRGGRWGHKPPPEYWRLWRAAHPEYRERERQRRLLAKAFERLKRALED